MLGFWEGGVHEITGETLPPDGAWMEGGAADGSDPEMEVPRGQTMGGGKICEALPDTPRRTVVWFHCNATLALEEPVLEPSQITYTVPLDGNAVMTWAPEGSPTPAQPELLPFGPVVGFRCE